MPNFTQPFTLSTSNQPPGATNITSVQANGHTGTQMQYALQWTPAGGTPPVTYSIAVSAYPTGPFFDLGTQFTNVTSGSVSFGPVDVVRNLSDGSLVLIPQPTFEGGRVPAKGRQHR